MPAFGKKPRANRRISSASCRHSSTICGVARVRALPERTSTLAEDGNTCARLTLRVYSPAGQAFLAAVGTVLAKPPSQDVVTTTFDLLRDCFAALRPEGHPDPSIADLFAEAEGFATIESPDPDVVRILQTIPDLALEVPAMRVFSGHPG